MSSVSVVAEIDHSESEGELREAVAGLVRALRPTLIVETGAYKGAMTEALGRAAAQNRHGRVLSYEPNHDYADIASRRCTPYPVGVIRGRSEDFNDLEYADFLFLDSDYKYRRDEIARAKPGAVIVVHDAYKSYDPNIEPLAPLIESLGGVCFRCGIEGRGFGILIKR